MTRCTSLAVLEITSLLPEEAEAMNATASPNPLPEQFLIVRVDRIWHLLSFLFQQHFAVVYRLVCYLFLVPG